MLEGSRVDVVVIPGPLLLADLESVLLDAVMSDDIPGPLLLADMESVLLDAESDDDGGENNVTTELALFSFWLVFILSC